MNNSGNQAHSCADAVPSLALVRNCREAKRAITAWLEQYGSEASDDLFNATIGELLWLDLMPRREYQNTPGLQAGHAENTAKLAAAYAEWKR